mmetsp:Transcript_37039/g.118759  ORF Transcript_37039/g.118759 Transcript_37039/m.118759 type:complete len:135 (+) Transcript_37039:3471-3875(+)
MRELQVKGSCSKKIVRSLDTSNKEAHTALHKSGQHVRTTKKFIDDDDDDRMRLMQPSMIENETLVVDAAEASSVSAAIDLDIPAKKAYPSYRKTYCSVLKSIRRRRTKKLPEKPKLSISEEFKKTLHRGRAQVR